MNKLIVTFAIGVASTILIAGCGGSKGANDSPDPGISDAGSSDELSIARCFQQKGWQFDYVVDADLSGIPDSSGTACTDADTAEWYEENADTNSFDHRMAWNSFGDSTCMTRSPAPVIDGVLCTFHGTHTWEQIPGVDPAQRMVLTEKITSVSGDFDGDGAEDHCGRFGILENNTTRYVVVMEGEGECESGAKVWMWEPAESDTEPVPGNIFADDQGRARPLSVCTRPGTIGPEDHMPGRKVCLTSITVTDR